MLTALAVFALAHTVVVGHGVIQYGDKDKTPTKKDFVVAYYSDHAIFEAPDLWKIVHNDKLVSVYDLAKSRCVEYVPDPNRPKDKPSPLYPYIKRIFPVIPQDYAIAQSVEEGEAALAKIKTDDKAHYSEGSMKSDSGEIIPGAVQITYKDKESTYQNEIMWVVYEDKEIVPHNSAFMLTQPDGMQWTYNFTSNLEEGDDPDSGPPAHASAFASVRVTPDDLEKNTKNGKLAIKWLEEFFGPPKFSIANHGS